MIALASNIQANPQIPESVTSNTTSIATSPQVQIEIEKNPHCVLAIFRHQFSTFSASGMAYEGVTMDIKPQLWENECRFDVDLWDNIDKLCKKTNANSKLLLATFWSFIVLDLNLLWDLRHLAGNSSTWKDLRVISISHNWSFGSQHQMLERFSVMLLWIYGIGFFRHNSLWYHRNSCYTKERMSKILSKVASVLKSSRLALWQVVSRYSPEPESLSHGWQMVDSSKSERKTIKIAASTNSPAREFEYVTITIENISDDYEVKFELFSLGQPAVGWY
ncbi:hypothetical protein BDZ45DRAFT_736178 [Acephala macrosclerotiorum]|nr:hypothetical protein BDZ45DRAFT_736178 [Acephala macrosclerotiorum]